MDSVESRDKNVLLASVPDGVEVERFVDLIGTFISMRSPNPYSSDVARNVYIAHVLEGNTDKRDKVAVLGVDNLTAANRVMLKFFMENYQPDKCVLCASALTPDSFDADPIVDGRCCDACNAVMLVPYRQLGRLACGKYGSIELEEASS